MDLPNVAAWLGHSDVTVTLRHYISRANSRRRRSSTYSPRWRKSEASVEHPVVHAYEAPVAQGTEQRTSNPRVGGSNPPRRNEVNPALAGFTFSPVARVPASTTPDRRRGRRHRRQAAAPEPVNRRWNLRGRAVQTERHERRVRVLCPALHAHVACLRRMRRWADSLTCGRVEVSERRAGRRTNGQARCRSHHEDPLPHLAPFVNDTHIRLYYRIDHARHPQTLVRRQGPSRDQRDGLRVSVDRERTYRQYIVRLVLHQVSRCAGRGRRGRVHRDVAPPPAL
jgi:hypothetical protein